MNTSEKVIDIAVLALLSIMSVYTLYLHYAEGYVVYLNLFVGVFMLIGSIGFYISGKAFANYTVLILLVLFAIGIINFLPFSSQVGESTQSILYNFQFSGLNPAAIVLLLIYMIINRRFISSLYNKLFRD